MRRLLAVWLLLAACTKEKPQRVAPDLVKGDGLGQAELRFGGGDDEPHHLTFHITGVRKDGEWTAFDAALDTDAAAKFTVSNQLGKSAGGFAFGKARMTVPDSTAGAHFVDAFAKAFAGKPVPPAAKRGTLEPFDFSIAVLGVGNTRETGGSFSSRRGGWVATKWFPTDEDVEDAEVFFNYDLTNKVGELSEKDSSYANDLVAVFARELRDGAPPPRTPENDPTLSLSGPVFENETRIGDKWTGVQSFDKSGVLYSAGSVLMRFDAATGKTVKLAAVEHDLSRAICDGDLCAIREAIPQEPGVISSTDPARLWLLEKGTLTALPAKARVELADAPLAPGGRFIAWSEWRDKKTDRGAYTVLCVLDRKTDKVSETSSGDKSWALVGWELRAGKPVALVEDGHTFDEGRGAYDLDPVSGALTPAKRPLKHMQDMPLELSPDGKRSRDVKDGKLVITDVATKKTRTLELHPLDARHASNETVGWLSARYLGLNGGFLDADTLKVSFPVPAKSKLRYEIAPDFSRALLHREDGLYIATVVVK